MHTRVGHWRNKNNFLVSNDNFDSFGFWIAAQHKAIFEKFAMFETCRKRLANDQERLATHHFVERLCLDRN